METFEWPPLESDPEIFTKYLQNLGLNSSYHFEELFTLDYVPEESNILAIIISYETGSSGKLKRDEENYLNFNKIKFYMKQTKKLDNACGVIASLHAIGNLKDEKTISENTILNKFFKESETITDEERALNLENSNEFKKAHSNFAGQGQSNLCLNQDDVKNHFVTFVYNQNSILELDGCIKGPYVVKKDVSKENFAQEVFKEIKLRLEKGNISDNLAMMYLTKD